MVIVVVIVVVTVVTVVVIVVIVGYARWSRKSLAPCDCKRAKGMIQGGIHRQCVPLTSDPLDPPPRPRRHECV